LNTLQGKVAVVTGSTSGIGLGIAQVLAAQGVDLVLNGFGEPADIERIVAEIGEIGPGRAMHHGADMTRPGEIEDLVAEAVGSFGAVDILVNNAGIQHTAPIEDFPVERWDAILSVNLSSGFHAIRASLPGMRKRGWGRIVNVASVHGLVASVHKAAYVAAKHGLIGLTKVVALEAAGSGITCNAICPGFVLTPLVQKQIDDHAEREGISDAQATEALLAEKQPSRTFATPEQIGHLAAFLCSPAADNITGASLPIDGAWTAQ
jgi:3-hydroxybutyrate dehydrogenase